jgi:hypothetical protein
MDLSKYPFEKLFYVVAGIIPGFVALLIFQLASPGSFGWFFALGFLGYKTKLTLILLAAFIVGNSMTAFLRGLLGGIGGSIGTAAATKRPFTPPSTYEIAPWRDPRWRTALTHHIGAGVPNDTSVMSSALLDLKRKQIDLLPEAQRPAALGKVNLEKISTDVVDGRWAQWYDHYHRIVLFDHDKRELDWYVLNGLHSNLQTAAVYVLISALFVPSVRRWWCILPAFMWVLILVGQEYWNMNRLMDPWSTLSEQIKYLTALEPLKGPAKDS